MTMRDPAKKRFVPESNKHHIDTASEPPIGLAEAHTDRLGLLLLGVVMPAGTEVLIVSGRSEIYLRGISAIYLSSPRAPLKHVVVRKHGRSGQPQLLGWGNRESGEI
jgi:hypothetical protein